MYAPLALFALSAMIAAAARLPGTPLHPDLAPVAVLAALAAGGLLVRAWLTRVRTPALRLPRKRILVDGSNVLYWADNTPDPVTIITVLQALKGQGYAPVIWFDANIGHLIDGRYMNAKAMAQRIGLPQDAVHVAKRGTPADPMILSMAMRDQLRIVTNDRYRDWHETYPHLALGGLLVPGRIEDGQVVLDPASSAGASSPRRAGPDGRRSSGPSSSAPPPPLPRQQTAGQAGRRTRQAPPPPAA